jgi:hypothetical protein
MKDKENSLGSKLFGLFVAEEGDQPIEELEPLPDEEPAPKPPPAPSTVNKGNRGSTAPASNSPAEGEDPVLSADFDTLYTRLCEGGDPNTESILTAYGEMSKTLSDKILATAMNSMIKGIRADVGQVRDTLSKRHASLQNIVEHKKKYYGANRNARARELDQKRVAVQAQVQQLQTQIATLTEELTRSETETQQADAEDLGTMEAFNQRVSAEFARLSSLGQFLDSISPPKRG